MAWSMLNNGVCPPEPPAPLRFVKISSGYYVNMAIDSLGRMYAWGSSSYQYQGQTPVPVPSTPNFTRHPATFRVSPYYEAMVYPYQIGYPKSDWVDCQTVEYIHMALDSEGYIYAVGDDGGGGSVYGRGGWAVTTKYNEVINTFVPGGEQAIVMTLVNDQQWSSFVLGAYHVIAQKADKSLWIWGKNFDNATYGTLTYADDYISLTPIQMTWVPGPVKIFDAGYSVTAVVTESNQIYAWGNWANIAIGLKQIPYLVPFTVPIGTTIVDLKCNYSGIIILLSNGDIYGIGWRIGFVAPPADAMVFTLAPGEHNFVKIWCALETGAAALDSSGVIWGWGNQSYLIVQGGIDDIASTIPAFTSGADPSIYRWTDFAAGSWSYLAINNEGRLFSWGTPVYGLQGIGLFESEGTELYSAIECGPFATLENDINAYESYAPGGAISAVQNIIQSPDQLSEHNPCGHWHREDSGKFADESTGDLPVCCWSFAVAIQGPEIALHCYAIKEPFANLSIRYNISTRIWSKAQWILSGIYCGRYLNGAALDGEWEGAYMFAETTNSLLIKLMRAGDKQVKESAFIGGGEILPQTCDGKIAIGDARNLAVILIQAPTQVILWSANLDDPTNFDVQRSWLIDPSFKGTRVVHVVTDGYYYVAIFSGTSISFRRAFLLNVWEDRTVITVPAEATKFNMWTENGIIFVLCHDKLYYSSDGAATFVTRNVSQVTNVGVANGVTKNALMFYLDKIEKTLTYEASTITWNILPIVPEVDYTINDYTIARSSSNYVVYMRENIFIERRIVVPISQDFGNTWELVQSPLDYFDSSASAFAGVDDPRWKFNLQGNKIPLDPQYA